MDQYPFEFNVIMFLVDIEEIIDQLHKDEKTKWLGDEFREQLTKQLNEF